ncbi:hypothetical protein OOZ58_20605 [Streptomyces tauricus]|nr:hypothetical protein [Streptomyces tauricus]MCW8098951.1 hypothetical protein [Streptomyces tauricus]
MTPVLRDRGGAGHESGLGGLASECERGKRFGAEVDRQDLQDGQRQRDLPPGECEDEEGDDLGHRVGEDVEHELADVVEDASPRVDRGDDGGEVVVGEHHGGCLTRHVCSRSAHGDTDVGVAQGGSVVDAVSGHRDHLAPRAQGFADAQFGLW